MTVFSSLSAKFTLCVLSSICAQASTINFEDLSNQYFFSAGGQNIDNFYTGVTIGPGVTALSVSRFGGYPNSSFPPHSGDVAVWDAQNPTITIGFNSPIDSFKIWYTSFDPLSLQALGAGNVILGSAEGNPNTDGTTGTSSLLSFSGSGIQMIQLSSTAGLFVLDDLTYASGTAVPEPASIFLFCMATVVALAALKFQFFSGLQNAGSSAP